jgi:beta-glucanase (GH16 family)
MAVFLNITFFIILTFLSDFSFAKEYDVPVTQDGWVLEWNDEFNNDNLDLNVWDRQVLIKPFNNELQSYTGEENTAFLSGGFLVIQATKLDEKYRKGSFVSARVISNPGGSTGIDGSPGKTVKFGRIMARIKLPTGKGIWPAFWLLGDNIKETGGDTAWPRTGEIDIIESGYSGNLDGYWGHATVGGAVHFDSSESEDKLNHQSINGKKIIDKEYGSEFHVFELQWDSNTITWRVDGEEFFTLNIQKEIFSELKSDFYIIFNVAVGGHLTDSPDNSTLFPQKMYVDWIRYYKADK